MQSFFHDKVVVVTGGTEGIGKALVDLLMALGAKVSTCGRNQDKLYALQLTYSGKPIHVQVADISRSEDCEKLIQRTVNTFGKIDILINNAGISMRGLLEDTHVDVIKRVMDVNFFGTVYCTKFALEHLIASKGILVGVSSIAGYRGLPGRSGYSASKFALQGWLESIKTELSDKKVHVMWVCPGFTASNIRNAALNEKGDAQGESPMDEESMMTAKEVAIEILKSIQKKKRTLILTFTGKRAVFLNRFFPKFTDKLIRKFYFKEGKLIH
ncbi:MAG: SDR family oxidoreductase [Chitinophagaceae bacterium]